MSAGLENSEEKHGHILDLTRPEKKKKKSAWRLFFCTDFLGGGVRLFRQSDGGFLLKRECWYFSAPRHCFLKLISTFFPSS